MRGIIFLAVTFAALFISGCADKAEAKKIRIAMPVWPGYEPLNIAEKMGYNAGKKVAISILPSTSETKTAFKNGIVDVAALTLDEVIHLAQEIPDIRVILITDISNGGDAILGQPGITTLEELKGKVVGLESNALSTYLLSRAVALNGKIELDDIVISPIGAAEHEKAFRLKKVDGLVTYEPLRSILTEEGATILFDSSMIAGEIIDVLIVRESVAKELSSELVSLVKGWFKALQFMKSNPREATAMMAANEGVSSSEFSTILKGMTFPSLEENQRLFQNGGEVLNSSAQKVKFFMESKRIVTRPVDLESMFSGEYLPQKAIR